MRNPIRSAVCVAVALWFLNGASVPAADEPSLKPPVTGEPPVNFKVEQIDKSLKIGYGLVVADLNADGRPDVVVCDAERVIWFESPSWKLHTIVDSKKAGITTDNVCIDVADIDGDGKLDVALGADWQPNNTAAGGSLQWLQQPANIDEPWKVFPIAPSIPTLHRVHFGDLDGNGKPELYVGPLKGKGSTAAANWTDAPAPLYRYAIPAKVTTPDAKWEGVAMTDSLHVMHNYLPAPDAPWKGVITASYEGLNLVQWVEGKPAAPRQIGVGNQDKPKESRGSSEVKRGKLFAGDLPIFASIEPFHGTQVVVYTAPAKGADLTAILWNRTVLDDTLRGGHSIACGDFDGDGDDEVVAGWRDGDKTGINLYKATRIKEEGKAGKDASPVKWTKYPLDTEIAAEDLAIADLNGDKLLDIVACGRKTKDVKIYWNQGKAGR